MSENKKKWKLKPIPVIIAGVVVIVGIAAIVTAAYRASSTEPQQTATVSVSQKNLKGDGANTASQANSVQTTVEIQLEDTAIAVGTVLKVTAIVTPQDTDHALVWNSSNENVFTVDKDGVVTVRGTGIAALTATVGTVSDAITIEGIAAASDGSERGLPVYTGGSSDVKQLSENGNTAAVFNNSASDISGRTKDVDAAIVNHANAQENSNATATTDNTQNNQGNNKSDSSSNSGETPIRPENSNEVSDTPSSTSSGAQSSQIADALPGMGFTQRMSNVYVCEEAGTYYGEIITQPNVTIIYIKQRSAVFDGLIQNVLASLLPSEAAQVWSNYLSATSDRTFEAEGRRVRIVTALNGGHSQIVIYN